MWSGHMGKNGLMILGKQGLLGKQKMGELDFYGYCVFEKYCRIKFSEVLHKTKGTLDHPFKSLGPFSDCIIWWWKIYIDLH